MFALLWRTDAWIMDWKLCCSTSHFFSVPLQSPNFYLFLWSRQSFPLEFSITDYDFLPVNFFFQSYFLFAQSYTITCWVFRAFYHKMEVCLTTVFCSILVLPNWISALLNKILIRKKSDTFFFIFIHTKWPTLNSFCFSCRNMD